MSRKKKLVVAVFVLLVGASAFPSVVGMSAEEPSITIEDLTVARGKTGELQLLLDTAPPGLRILEAKLELENPDVANFVAIEPKAVSKQFFRIDKEEPKEIVFRMVDLKNKVGKESKNVVLASLQVRGISPGDTDLSLTVNNYLDEASNSLSVPAVRSNISVTKEGQKNAVPEASFTYSPSNPSIDDAITFDASDSTDPDGSISTYKWDFDDGNTGKGVTTNHTFSEDSTYSVTLTVEDDDGATDTVTKQVEVSKKKEEEPEKGEETPEEEEEKQDEEEVTEEKPADVKTDKPDQQEAEEEKEKEDYEFKLVGHKVGVTKSSYVEFTVNSMPNGLLYGEIRISASGDLTLGDLWVVRPQNHQVKERKEKNLSYRFADFDQEFKPGGEGITLAMVKVSASQIGEAKVEGSISFATNDGEVLRKKIQPAVVEIVPPTVGSSKAPPNDLDGDGLYEDVNGDRKVTIQDAYTLTFNLTTEAVQRSASIFDFNDDGSVSFADARALYQMAEETAS